MALGLVERFTAATERAQLHADPADLQRFGIRTVTRTAKAHNFVKYGRTYAYRRKLYRDRFDELLADHGAPVREPAVMRDGWAIDDSRTNPHIDRAVEAAEAVIAERGMTRKGRADRAFIRDILEPADLAEHPAFLDFATSPDVLATVARYMRLVPLLSSTVPPGIRLTESSIDGQVDSTYRTSQLYHLDLHDTRLVYVILLLRDVTPESGPFTFLPDSASTRVVRELGHLKRGSPYRLSDEEVHRVARPEEAVSFEYPRGSILYMDSSRCLHYGSRDAVDTRYQLMCAYVSPCRADFSEERVEPRTYPAGTGDSALRRLLLDKSSDAG